MPDYRTQHNLRLRHTGTPAQIHSLAHNTPRRYRHEGWAKLMLEQEDPRIKTATKSHHGKILCWCNKGPRILELKPCLTFLFSHLFADQQCLLKMHQENPWVEIAAKKNRLGKLHLLLIITLDYLSLDHSLILGSSWDPWIILRSLDHP